MSYYFHPGAEAEYLETIAFFESRQIGLGAAYILELEAVMANVVNKPCS
jgi:toxin ParE1/3/4